jgi:hypothetical protein
MNRHTFILIGIIFLYSCGKQKTDYYLNESKVVNEKIIYNLKKIQGNYMLNPGMAKPYFEIAYYLKTSFDSILYFVDQGNKIKVQNGLKELYNSIKSNAYFDSEYIKEVIIPNRFDKSIDNIEKSNYFENKDMVKLDLLNIENELTNYLYNSIEADYYKFNKLSAIVVDSSANIKLGDTYHANIFLAAEDTTYYPSIMVADFSQPDSVLLLNKPDNKRIFYVDAINGKGNYKKKVDKLGKHGFKGVIQIRNSNGKLERFKFYKEFTVRK